ncbi:MAG: hypothetical protein ACMG6E_01090 [Candidatus Roizmanbacteria bacterium]
MLSNKVLNGIIILSLLGLLGVQIREAFYPKKLQSAYKNIPQEKVPVPTETTNPEPLDAPCNSSYLPNTINKTFSYSLESSFGIGIQPQVTKQNDTYQIVASDSSSFQVLKMPKKALSNGIILHCKTDGIYGFPFELIDTKELGSMGEKVNTSELLSSFLLVPSDDILEGQQTYRHALTVPNPLLKGTTLSVPLFYSFMKGVDENTVDITVISKEEATPKSKDIPGFLGTGSNPIDFLKDVKLQYSVKKNVGITHLSLAAQVQTIEIKSELNLNPR